MDTQKTDFCIELNGVTMTIEELSVMRSTGYRIVFSSPRKPLIIVRATNADKKKFWTSVPEGRQREAEGIGALIEEYIEKNS